MKLRMMMVEADDVSAADITDVLTKVFGGGLPALPTKPAIVQSSAGALPAPVADTAEASQRPRRHYRRRESASPSEPIATAAAVPCKARGKRGSADFECQERPGERFTIKEIAKLVGLAKVSVYSKLLAAKKFKLPWATMGNFHVRRAATPSPSVPETPVPDGDAGEAHSRFNHRSTAINPNVIGSARVDVDDEDDETDPEQEG